jgi:anti-sigma B factor antagonist
MASAKKAKSASKALRIEGEFTIFRAAELMPVLMSNPPPLEIDLSGVTEFDTAGLQLLMQAKKVALAAKRELRLVGHSPAVIEVFELLNVSPYFGDPLVMDSRAGTAPDRTTNSSAGRRSNGS